MKSKALFSLKLLKNKKKKFEKSSAAVVISALTHCRLNRLSHTIYWKSPISILGRWGYEIYIFLEKNG